MSDPSMSVATDATPAASTTAPPRRRRWLRRLLAASILIGLIVVFHGTLLGWVAEGLIVDEQGSGETVVISGGYGPFGQLRIDEATDLYRQGAVSRIVLIEDRSFRLARLQIVPTLESVVRRELDKQNVPPEALTVLTLAVSGESEQARCLRNWLQEHPEARVTYLCDQFTSRRIARIFRQVCSSEESSRIHVRGLPDRRFDETNWWRGRQGIVTVAGEYVSLGFVLVRGEETLPAPWDPDQFEKTLCSRDER